MTRLILSVLLAIIFLIPLHSSAAIYKYKDENGKMHFTDSPLKIPEQYRDKEGPSEKPEIEKEVIKENPAANSPPEYLAPPKETKIRDLQGSWSGWGGVVLARDGNSYTGTYQDTYGTDVGNLLLEMNLSPNEEFTGKWWEGEARIGELEYKVSEDGRSIRGTWCALDSSTIRPGSPSCDKPRSFSWSRR